MLSRVRAVGHGSPTDLRGPVNGTAGMKPPRTRHRRRPPVPSSGAEIRQQLSFRVIHVVRFRLPRNRSRRGSRRQSPIPRDQPCTPAPPHVARYCHEASRGSDGPTADRPSIPRGRGLQNRIARRVVRTAPLKPEQVGHAPTYFASTAWPRPIVVTYSF